MVKRTREEQQQYEQTPSYAWELLRNYWMGLRHPNKIAEWSNALQDLIQYDHNDHNLSGYLIVRDNETGVVHIFGETDIKHSVLEDVKKGLYTVIKEHARIPNNPTPLNPDRIIPFVIGNYTHGSYTKDLDTTKIPSPLPGYVPTIEDIFGKGDVATHVNDSIARRFHEFSLLDQDYVIGYLRLITNRIEDGVEYAYLYHGSKNPKHQKGMTVYLRHLTKKKPWSKASTIIITDGDTTDFYQPKGQLSVPGAVQSLRIWTDHVLKNFDSTGSMAPFQPITESFRIWNDHMSIDTHKPHDIEQIFDRAQWVNKDELNNYHYSVRSGIRNSFVPYAYEFSTFTKGHLNFTKPFRAPWEIYKKGKVFDVSENYGDLTKIHESGPVISDYTPDPELYDILKKYDKLYISGIAPNHPILTPESRTQNFLGFKFFNVASVIIRYLDTMHVPTVILKAPIDSPDEKEQLYRQILSAYVNRTYLFSERINQIKQILEKLENLGMDQNDIKIGFLQYMENLLDA